MSVFEFDFEYDQELDPTPEDNVYTDEDLKILYIQELTNLDPADLGLWREKRLKGLAHLLAVGVESGPGLVLPAEQLPDVDEWDDQGFAILRDADGNESFLTIDRRMYETALRWKQSGNRLLVKGHDVLRRNTFLLPIERFRGNAAFEEYYLRNLTCDPKSPQVFGRSGYFSRTVWSTFLEETRTDRNSGEQFIAYVGGEIVEDAAQPLAASTPRKHLEMVMEKWDKRWGRRGGPGYDHVIQVVSPGIVFDADRKVEERYEGWVPPAAVFRFNRQAEIEAAMANANY